MDGEGGFDPCECINSHDSSMRRLLGMLRQSQSYCTEASCNEQPPSMDNTGSLDGGINAVMAIAAAWGAMMLGMYMLGTGPRNANTDGKPNRRDGNNNTDFDPEPPALT